MKTASKGQRLARRYPVLNDVPEDRRAELVRAALRHPLLLGGLAVFALLLLPRWFDVIFAVLDVGREENMMLFLGKMGGAVLVPLLIVVPLLSRFIMPALLRREMHKRGLGKKDGDNPRP